MQLWLRGIGPASNYGFQVDTIGQTATHWKRFISSEETSSSSRPKLSMTYHTPTATAVAKPAFTGERTFSWTYSDPVATPHAQTMFEVQLSADGGATWPSALDSLPVASGAASWTAPSSVVLADLAAYAWRVRVYNGTSWSAYSAASSFTYDALQTGEEPYYTRVPFHLGGGWGLDVGVHNGEARFTRDLFAIPSYGPGQSLSLAYSSLQASAVGPFGAGWSSNLTQTLAVNAATSLAIWRRDDGGREAFSGSDAAGWAVVAGHHDTLARSGTEYTITKPDGSSLAFDAASGRLKRVVDRFGVALTIAWGTGTATATDASGRQTVLTLDAATGRVTWVRDSALRAWALGYSASGTLCRLSEGATVSLQGLASPCTTPVASSGPDDNVMTRFSYDAAARLTGVTRQRTPYGGQAADTAWQVGYDTSGRAASVSDPVGGTAHASTFTYLAGETDVSRPRDAAGAVPPSTTYFYLDPAHPAWVASAEQFVTSPSALLPVSWTTVYTHDASGDVTSATSDVDATHTVMSGATYDASSGLVLTSTDPLGIATTYQYGAGPYHDLLAKTVSHTQGGVTLQQVTSYAYDATHHLCRQVDNPNIVDPTTLLCTTVLTGSAPDQNIDRRYGYDANNEMTSDTDPLGFVVAFGYDAVGDQTSATRNYVPNSASTDSVNVTTTFTYDAAGNVLSQTVPVSAIGPVSLTTTYTYDLLGRGQSETVSGDATAPATRTLYAYDELGAKVSVTQQACATAEPCTSWTSLSRTSTTLDALGNQVREVEVTLAADGSLSETLTTTYAPDLVGDVLSVTEPGGSTTTASYDAVGRQASSTSDGLTTNHRYDGLGRETQSVQPGGNGSTLTTDRVFDADGNLIQKTETDTADGSVAVTYDTFDALGRAATTTDATGLLTTRTYDRLGRLTRLVSGSSTTDTAYDRGGHALSRVGPYVGPTVPAGTLTVSRTFDPLGRQTAETNADGAATTAYNSRGDIIATVDRLGIVTRRMVNVQGTTVKTIDNCTNTGTTPPSDPATCAGTGTDDAATNVVTTTSFTAAGAILTTTRVAGGVTSTTTYDGGGRVLTEIVDAGGLNLTTQHSYDALGREVRVVAPGGVASATVYDDQGRVCRAIENATIDPATLAHPCTDPIADKTATANLDTVTAYDAAGSKTDETSPTGLVTHYTYDASGNVLTTTTDYRPGYNGQDASVNATTTDTYDSSGRVVREVDPAGTATATVYGADGNVCRIVSNATVDPSTLANPCTDPLPGQTSIQNADTRYSYDASGNRTRVVAPSPADAGTTTATATTLSAFDANGRLCRVVENAGAALDLYALADPCRTPISAGRVANVDAQYWYDADGNLTSQTVLGDPANGDLAATTAFAYDNLGRRTAETDPTGHTRHWTFDAAGNQVSQIDPGGSTTLWAYDAAGRLCRRTSGASISMPLWPCASTSPVSGAATDTRYSLDAAGNRTAVTDAITGRAVNATYDALARPLTVSQSGAGATAWPTTYVYGPSLGLAQRTDPAGVHASTLDTAGRTATLKTPLDASAPGYSWAYSATSAIASVTDPTGNKTTYVRDPLGRTTSVTTTGAASCSACASFAYSYNAAGARLGAVASVAGAGANGTTSYAYDPIGRLSRYTPPNTPVQTYGWNALPDRTSVQSGTDPARTTSYDAASRPVADASHASDGDGRVTKTPGSRPGEVLTLLYDPLGRLVQAQSSVAGTATYRYDPLDRLDAVVSPTATVAFAYVGLTDAVAAVTTTPSGGSASTRYVETDTDGGELLEYDSVARVPSYLGTDAHGDAAWTHGAAGSPTGWSAYDPFGGRSGTATSVAAWQGSWQDAFSGLYYVVARWYDPRTGAFTAEDPVEGGAESPQSLDPYPYGRGDPVGSTDPDGRAPVGTVHMVPGWNRINQFHEPIGTKRYPHDWWICVSGALRVVLAFTSQAPQWTHYPYPADGGPPYWPVPSRGYLDKNPGGRYEYPNSGAIGRDTWGQGYMLYLAYKARVPGLGINPNNGKTGSLFDWGQSNDPGTLSGTYAALRFANWETMGESTGGRDVDTPFGYGDHNTAPNYFIGDVKWSIDHFVPAAVGVVWSLSSARPGSNGLYTYTQGLPSWKLPSGHWERPRATYWVPSDCYKQNLTSSKCKHLHAVAIVGYDDTGFYYVDTCWFATSCRAGEGQTDATAKAGGTSGGRPYVWRISQGLLSSLMKANPQGGFYYWSGVGYWGSARHEPW